MVIIVVRVLLVVDNRFSVLFSFLSFPGLVYRAPRCLSRLGGREQHRVGRHVVLFAVVDPVQEVNQQTCRIGTK